MVKIKLLVVVIFLFVFPLLPSAFAYTVIAEEQGSVTYKADDSKVYTDIGRYKIYFEVDEKNKTIKRTKILSLIDDPNFGLTKGAIVMDEQKGSDGQHDPEGHSVTVYQIVEPLPDHPASDEKFIQAVGQPMTNAVELLTIGKNYIQQSRSTGEYVVVINSKIVDAFGLP